MYQAEGEGEVRWYEQRGRGFALHITPLEVATAFDAFREQVDAAWLFTSATLSVRGDFRHFTDRMGLQDAATLQLDSPFDYVNNARLWLPESLPEPRDPGFVPALLDDVVPLLEASRGRAFLLFTAHRSLRLAAELLAAHNDGRLRATIGQSSDYFGPRCTGSASSPRSTPAAGDSR